MKHSLPYETRSAEPIETRDEDGDPIATAAAAVEELRTAVEQHRTATDQRLSTELRTISERLDAIDIRSQRPGGAAERRDSEPDVETRAFLGFVRRGHESLGAEEVRALRVESEPAGGYLAPEQFVAEMLRNLVEVSPVRQAARVGQTTSGTVIIPRRTENVTAQWVGEIEDRPYTEPAYGQARIEMHEAAAYTDVSNWLLEDAAIDLAAELAYDFAEEFGRIEGEAFVNGNGVKKPLGFMADPAVRTVPNGSATAISADSLITMFYSLPAMYRNRGAWMLNTGSIAALRKLKDSSGAYLWLASMAEGVPPTLLGRPVIDTPDMPDGTAGAFPVAFGDFNAGYRIYDRVNLSVLRDPYTMATKGIVRFHARRRVGGAVVRPEAIVKLSMVVS